MLFDEGRRGHAYTSAAGSCRARRAEVARGFRYRGRRRTRNRLVPNRDPLLCIPDQGSHALPSC
jgi:hypothetical protein